VIDNSNDKVIEELIKRIQKSQEYLKSLDGKIVDGKDPLFLPGGLMLHQDTPEMDRYESAKRERDNKEAMSRARHVASEFKRRLRK